MDLETFLNTFKWEADISPVKAPIPWLEAFYAATIIFCFTFYNTHCICKYIGEITKSINKIKVNFEKIMKNKYKETFYLFQNLDYLIQIK